MHFYFCTSFQKFSENNRSNSFRSICDTAEKLTVLLSTHQVTFRYGLNVQFHFWNYRPGFVLQMRELAFSEGQPLVLKLRMTI